jgi:hypothetical protein
MIRNEYTQQYFAIEYEEWRTLTAILLYVFVGLNKCKPMKISEAINRANEMIETLKEYKIKESSK